MSPLLLAMRVESLPPAGLLSQICEMWVSLSLLSTECYFSLKSRGEGRVIWGFSGDFGGEGEGLSLPGGAKGVFLVTVCGACY